MTWLLMRFFLYINLDIKITPSSWYLTVQRRTIYHSVVLEAINWTNVGNFVLLAEFALELEIICIIINCLNMSSRDSFGTRWEDLMCNILSGLILHAVLDIHTERLDIHFSGHISNIPSVILQLRRHLTKGINYKHFLCCSFQKLRQERARIDS